MQREHFNSELKKLAVLADTETKLPVFLNNYQDILNKYAVGDPLELKREQMEHPHYDELERLVFDQLQEHKHRVHIAKGISSNKILTLTEGRMEFDRLEKYLPGDDIREIDWNVTARNVKGEAIVRKKIKNEAFKVAFLLDLRNLSEQEDRINWAGDFVKSIKVVGQERKLDTLIFVLPEGDVTMQNLKTADLDQQSLAKRVMAQVKEKCDQVFVRHIHEPIKGLKFYNDRENERYRQNISLGLYDSTQEEGKLKHINVKNLNIFMVGVKVDKRNEIDSLVGRRNRRFYW